nr:MAG TPA: hypothetical protein [Crassvirales sp.]
MFHTEISRGTYSGLTLFIGQSYRREHLYDILTLS